MAAAAVVAEAPTQAAAVTIAPSEPAEEAPAGQVPSDPVDTAWIEFGTIGRDVIVELHVQMESDDIARTVAAIASSDISYGTVNADGKPNRDGHAVLVIKVPPAEVGNVLSQLGGTGTVLSVNQSAQDVTDQPIGLDVRIANKCESVENVRQMMDAATNQNDIVSLEGQLAMRQTEPEPLEAQHCNLSGRVSQ